MYYQNGLLEDCNNVLYEDKTTRKPHVYQIDLFVVNINVSE